MELQKIVLRAYNLKEQEFLPYHFCYLEKDLSKRFFSRFVTAKNTMTSWLRRWAMEDFNIPVRTAQDLQKLKEAVIAHYKTIYPDLSATEDSDTDRMGFARIWLTKRVKEALDE